MPSRATQDSFAPWHALVVLVVIHAGLLGWSAWRTSPVLQEPAHLAAGLSHWQQNHYALYRVNPPAVRMLAALPLLFGDVATDWTRVSRDPLRRTEFVVGQDFLRASAGRLESLFFWPRVAVLPLSVVGLVVCYWWSRDLFGPRSGLLAASLWTFSPTVLGHASLITPDAHAAALAVAAMYGFFRWLRQPSGGSALIAGIALGVAQLFKTTLLLLYPVLPILWLVRIATVRPARAQRELIELGLMLGVSVVVLDTGYGFSGVGTRLGDYCFRSELLGGAAPGGPCRNRFIGTLLENVVVPLPADYVQGIDAQRVDFEQQRRSYLRGRWQVGGWSYYYLYATLIKTPLGGLALAGLSMVGMIASRRLRVGWLHEATLLLPMLTIFTVVSSQTGFSIHPRYVLPALPMGLIWISRVADTAFRSPRVGRAWRVATLSSATMFVASSLWCFPHSLSYVHELAGGPREGHRQLLDSGYAWGQDLYHLKRWVERRDSPEPLYLLAFSYLNPADIGLDYQAPSGEASQWRASDGDLPPGWYAVDVNYLMGSDEPAPRPTGERLTLGLWGDVLDQLRRRTPVARVGYSFWIYRIAAREARQTGASGRPSPCRLRYRPTGADDSIEGHCRSFLFATTFGSSVVADPLSNASQDDRSVRPVASSGSVSFGREWSQTSTTLISSAQALEPEAWQRLSDEYSSLVYRWCRRAGLGEEDSADVAQEVLTAAWRHIATFRRDRPGDRLRKWIRAITTNKLRDHWRRREQEKTVGGTSWFQTIQQVVQPERQAPQPSKRPSSDKPADPRVAAIEKVRHDATPRDWTIFERTVIDEYAAREVAQELGITTNVVYLVKSRLLRQVKERFEDFESTSGT